MAEDALRRFARLLGGVVLTHGRLGHQVLGQLLIVDATDVEAAGANLAVAATSGQRNAFAQAAIRTAVPALAVHALLRKREKRLETRERRLAECAGLASAASHADAAAKLAALDAENRKLREELAALQACQPDAAPPDRAPPDAAPPDDGRVPPDDGRVPPDAAPPDAAPPDDGRVPPLEGGGRS